MGFSWAADCFEPVLAQELALNLHHTSAPQTPSRILPQTWILHTFQDCCSDLLPLNLILIIQVR
jgi:hypothetical protein